MIYYNIDEEESENEEQMLVYDIVNAIDAIDKYIDTELIFPDYPISHEQAQEISQKRESLENLKQYIVDHRYEAPVVDLIETYMHHMNFQAVCCDPKSEAYKIFRNMAKAAEEAGSSEFL